MSGARARYPRFDGGLGAIWLNALGKAITKVIPEDRGLRSPEVDRVVLRNIQCSPITAMFLPYL
jgi:hypothetical protein